MKMNLGYRKLYGPVTQGMSYTGYGLLLQNLLTTRFKATRCIPAVQYKPRIRASGLGIWAGCKLFISALRAAAKQALPTPLKVTQQPG